MRKLYDSNNQLSGYSEYDGYVTTTYSLNWAVTSIALNFSATWTVTDGKYEYTDLLGDTYSYSVDGSNAVTGYTAQYANSAYVYSYDATSTLLNFSYSDGVTTTVYKPDGTVDHVIVNPDAFGGTTDGAYTVTDDAGTATTYFLSNSQVTHYTVAYSYTWEGVTYTTTYDYNGSDNAFLGYQYSDGTTIWSYGADWSYLGATVDLDSPNLIAVDGGYKLTDQWGTTTYYDATGHITGYEYSSSWDTYTYVSSYDENWNFLGSETLHNGVVENWTVYHYDGTGGAFSGYDYSDGTTVWHYNADWSFNYSSLDPSALGNLADRHDGTYGVTDAWGTTTIYDGNTVSAIIVGYETTSTWDSHTYVSTYDARWNLETSNTYDAGGVLLYSSEYSYTYDAQGNATFAGYQYFDGTTTWIYDSGWNLIDTQFHGTLSHDATDGYFYQDAWGTITYYDDANASHVTGYGYSYEYQDWYSGQTYTSVSRYDENWNFESSKTYDQNDHLLNSSTYHYDASGNFSGYDYFDGTTTWHYGADWSFISKTVDPGSLSSLGDGTYGFTDAWGTTTIYSDATGTNLVGYRTEWTSTYDSNTYISTYDENWNFLSSETRDSADKLLYSSEYLYADGVFSGYEYFDGTTTWTYDASWNLIGSKSDTTGMLQDADGRYYTTDAWGTTTYYDVAGHKTGYSTAWSDNDASDGWTSTGVSYYDKDWNWTGSEYSSTDHANDITNSSTSSRETLKDGSGTVTGYIETGTWDDGQGHTGSYEYDYDAGWNFQGGTRVDGAVTTVYNSDWTIASQTASVTGMDQVLENGTLVGYKDTDDWGTTTYYDLGGHKTGYSTTWADTDNSDGWTSTNTSYYDANWNWTGSDSTSTSNGITTSSSSSRVTHGDGSYDDIGSWSDGQNHSSSYEYHYNSNGNFTGGTRTDGVTTTEYDSNWVVVSQTADTSGMAKIDADWNTVVDADNNGFDDTHPDVAVAGYKSTDDWGMTTFYDLDQQKIGYSSTWSDEDGSDGWTSANTSYYDTNGNWIRSEYRSTDVSTGIETISTNRRETHLDGSYVDHGSFNDGQGHLSSWTNNYGSDGSFTGGSRIEGGVTTLYDQNWNVISQTADIGGMTAIDANWADIVDQGTTIFGYRSAEDQWGKISYYDTNGDQIGYSYTWLDTDASDGWTSSNKSFYDADNFWFRSENTNTDTVNHTTSVSSYSRTTETVDGVEEIVERGSNSSGPTGGAATFSETHEYRYDADWHFLGGTRTRNGIDYTIDQNWVETSNGGGNGDTTPPTVVGASFTEGDNASITIHFSEAVTVGGMMYQVPVSLLLNPDYSNGYPENAYLQTTNVTFSPDGTSVTLSTNATLTATDVVQFIYYGGSTGGYSQGGGLVDLNGNPLPSGEIWIGGTGASNIDLSQYGSWQPIQIRGNGGNDTLHGTSAADVVIDGGGADTLSGGEGADTIVLVENRTGLADASLNLPAVARDVVVIGLGDSDVNGRDIIQGSSKDPANTGFDVTSADAAKHDVLSLPSAIIAANVSHADGVDVGSIAKHSIVGGILTFEDASNNAIQINVNNKADAIAYLQANILGAGETVAFEIDRDSSPDGIVDRLVVFQNNGTAPHENNRVIADTIVAIDGVTGATLGTSAGANVVQIEDTQAPEPVGFALTSDGFGMDFAENVIAPSAGAVSLTLLKNGTEAMTITSVSGSGTASLDIHTDKSLAASDWVFANYTGQTTSNGIRDTAGNVLSAADDIAAGYGGSAEGSYGDNVINLSSASYAAASYDLNGAGGNDTLTGSAHHDWITGGTGADVMTGGGGEDEFQFRQGDGPLIGTPNAGVWNLSGGVDLITDFGVDDGLYLDWTAGSDPMAQTLGNGKYLVRSGTYSTGSFTEGAGSDTLVVYDADATASVAAAGIVLQGVTASQLMIGGNYISMWSVAVDTTPPSLQSAAVNGATLTLTYNETLDATSVPAADAFSVNVNNVETTVTNVAVSGATVTLTLGTAAAAGAPVTLAYLAPTTGPIQDSASNDAAMVTNYAVTNNTTSGGGTVNEAPYNTGAGFTETANATITLQFSEALTTSNGGAPSGIYFFKNPDYGNNNSGTQISGSLSVDASGTTVTFATGETLTATDVVQVTVDPMSNVVDASGMHLAGEVWIGGSGASTIDLDGYHSWTGGQVVIRGNGGADRLVGTNDNDVLIDGGGSDRLVGSGGADVIRLVENGGLQRDDGSFGPAYARDVVVIEGALGESVLPYTDIVAGSKTSTTGTGFDIWSSDANNHDQLSLTHNVIAADTSGFVTGTSAGTTIASHSISNGMVTFHDANGNAMTMSANGPDVAAYLEANVQNATGGFLFDSDNNGTVDSTIVFQGHGMHVDPTVVMLQGVAAVGVGTSAGAGIVQVIDEQAPQEVVHDELTQNGLELNFAEQVFVDSNQFALSFLLNGTTAVGRSISGSGTDTLTIAPVAQLAQDGSDWLLGTFNPTGASNSFSDAAGNWDSEGSVMAIGLWGNNSINLSGYASTGNGQGYDMNGWQGNDTLTGSAYDDNIRGGTGADIMTGGQGHDWFEFNQGDSPIITVSGNVYSFTGGAADVITDFGANDGISLDMAGEIIVTSGGRTFGDNSYQVMQGSYANGSFTAGTGADTLLVYDGAPDAATAAMTGVVLSNVTASMLMTYGNYIHLYQ